MVHKFLRYFAIYLLSSVTHAYASDWVFVFEDDEQIMEFDRASIQPYDGNKFVRERVTFKKPTANESGHIVKYMTLGVIFSCVGRTEKISLVYKFGPDKKIISKNEINGMVMRADKGSISEQIMKKVCTSNELNGK